MFDQTEIQKTNNQDYQNLFMFQWEQEEQKSFRSLDLDDLLLSGRQNKKNSCCESSVLIVDDNVFNLIPLELLLEEHFGLKCDKAMNG